MPQVHIVKASLVASPSYVRAADPCSRPPQSGTNNNTVAGRQWGGAVRLRARNSWKYQN